MNILERFWCKHDVWRMINLVAFTLKENWFSEHIFMLAGLFPPAKHKENGRPNTSREKALYEGLSKGTRFCSICRQQGHKRTTCPDRGDAPKPVRKPARGKNCGIEGRRWNNCNKVGDLRMIGLWAIARICLFRLWTCRISCVRW